MLASCYVWKYATVEVHLTQSLFTLSIPPACVFDIDVSDVTATHGYRAISELRFGRQSFGRNTNLRRTTNQLGNGPLGDESFLNLIRTLTLTLAQNFIAR